jgi:hypothetical protein
MLSSYLAATSPSSAKTAGESNFLIFSDSFFPLGGQPMQTDGREAVEPNKTTAKEAWASLNILAS